MSKLWWLHLWPPSLVSVSSCFWDRSQKSFNWGKKTHCYTLQQKGVAIISCPAASCNFKSPAGFVFSLFNSIVLVLILWVFLHVYFKNKCLSFKDDRNRWRNDNNIANYISNPEGIGRLSSRIKGEHISTLWSSSVSSLQLNNQSSFPESTLAKLGLKKQKHHRSRIECKAKC